MNILDWLVTQSQPYAPPPMLPPLMQDPNINPRMGLLGGNPGPLASGIAPSAPLPPPYKPAAPVSLPSSGLLAGPAPAAPQPPPMKPTGLLGAPQPITPMAGGPQPVSPLVSGGTLPALPSGGLGGGGGFDLWGQINTPQFWRGLGGFGSALLAAGAPSTDPRAGSLAFALGQGLQGFQAGQDAYREEQRQAKNDEINAAYKMAIASGQGTTAKAPQVETFYDPLSGREYKAQWDGSSWQPVGGAKAPARVGGAGGGSGTLGNVQIDNERALRADYQKAIKDVVPVYDGWQRVQSGAQLGTGVGDMSIIFGYMKMLDPTSVVREGEYANARNAAGVPEQIMAEYNRLVGGGVLSTTQRQQFLQAAESAWKPFEKRYEDAKRVYGDLATSYGMDPNRIIIDVVPRSEPGASQGGPKPGEIIDGYRFLGGDRNDENNYEYVGE